MPNIHKSRLDPILFYNDARLCCHDQFSHIVEFEFCLNNFATDICEFVVLSLTTDYLCEIPNYKELPKSTYDEHLFACFTLIELGWNHLKIVNFAQLQML